MLISLNAQTNLEGKKLAYRFEENVIIDFHSRGFGLGGSSGKIKGIYKTIYTNFEISYYRHPKEKRNFNIYEDAGAYVYGKEHALLNLKLHRKIDQTLFFKADFNGIRVNRHFAYGLTLGVLKPYYLNVWDRNINDEIDIRYSEETALSFLDQNMINGSAGYGKGLFESEIVPALNLEYGLGFDFGTYDEWVRILEVGLRLDTYYKKISIMVFEDSNRYFLTLYARLMLGTRSLS